MGLATRYPYHSFLVMPESLNPKDDKKLPE